MDEGVDWSAADKHCRELGGLLVEIDSSEENEAILGEIRKHGKEKKQYWIGFTDRGVSFNVDCLNKIKYWGGERKPI